MKFTELTAMQKDVLKEVSNIGAGNAATSLATMMNKKIDMEVPNLEIAPLQQIPDIVGGAETQVVGVFFHVRGALASNLLFLLDTKSAQRLSQWLLKDEPQIEESISELQASFFGEIGNILGSAYLGALTQFTNLDFSISVPMVGFDMAGAILNTILVPLSEVGNHALLIENVFIDDDKTIKGNFFFLPNPGTFERVFSSLGV